MEVLGGKEKAGKGERRDRMIEREDKMRGVRGREKHGKGLGGSSNVKAMQRRGGSCKARN